ncbi:MAG: hypothetical protein ACM3SR_09610, partial [Ignavibacteriales bacterium]
SGCLLPSLEGIGGSGRAHSIFMLIPVDHMCRNFLKSVLHIILTKFNLLLYLLEHFFSHSLEVQPKSKVIPNPVLYGGESLSKSAPSSSFTPFLSLNVMTGD